MAVRSPDRKASEKINSEVFIMDLHQFDHELHEKVAEVKEDLELQAGYQLTNDQYHELLATGRTSIPMMDFVPYLQKVVAYLHTSDDEDVIWKLNLNSFSGKFEITLKNIEINFR